jgi:hypothetical protein
VPLEITPEPTPEEREVLVRALAALDGRSDGPSPWWRAGIREALEDDSGED